MALLAVSSAPWRAAVGWLGFFALVLAAWATLFAMSADFATRAPVSLLGPGMAWFAPLFPDSADGAFWSTATEAICLRGPAPGDVSGPALFGMWALMVLAMMMPSAVPLFRAYGDLVAGNPARVPAAGLLGLFAGFAFVWLGFAILGAAVQWALTQAGLLSLGGALRAGGLSAILLALAGLYQFSALKAACLSRCRSPMAFFLSHWRDGTLGAARMGLRQGLFCLGCCWALMALAFVGGTMNLIWMGGAMILMTLEKLPSLGRTISIPLGMALLSASAFLAGATLAN